MKFIQFTDSLVKFFAFRRNHIHYIFFNDYDKKATEGLSWGVLTSCSHGRDIRIRAELGKFFFEFGVFGLELSVFAGKVCNHL